MPWQPEQLENRRLLAFDLVAAYAASDQPFYAHGVTGTSVQLSEAPQQITLRFTPGIAIDPATLGGITIVRAGGDGLFGDANDVPLLPLGAIGHIAVDDLPNNNQVVIRFTESLPDDSYQIIVGDTVRSFSGETARQKTIDLRLDLGAHVAAVVPQPISRSGTGQLTQARNRIDVHFNVNDPLDKASAENAGFYRLIEVDADGADSGEMVSPAFVNYSSVSGIANLFFAAELPADRLYRLEIGGSPVDDSRTELTESEDNTSSFAGAQSLGTLSRSGVSVTGEIATRLSVATPAGPLLQPSVPGSRNEPGHRDHPFIDSFQHGNQFATIDPATGMFVLSYNFQDVIGQDPQGNVLYNVITETQKQRAREIFELFSLYAGVQFVETENLGLTVATGDLRALDPAVTSNVAGLGGAGAAYMNSSLDWGESEYGGGWFFVAMHEIGHALGLEHSYDLPSVMGAGLSRNPTAPVESVFPGNYDIGHLRQLYPIHGADIDLYRFTLPESGRVTLQTLVARPGEVATSSLDTVLTLYREDPFTGRRELIARNDDSFGRDSFLELDLRAEASGRGDDDTRPYVYFVAVSSTGNTAFNPEVADSGFGGRTEGAYELQIDFTPESWLATTVVDVTGTAIDGDRDGTPGGLFRFWFQTAAQADTVYVDKANPSGGRGNGSLDDPFTSIASAIAAAEADGSKRIIRIVGNTAGPGGRPLPYLIGTDFLGETLSDGETFNVPAGVTVMIDAGAVFKLESAIIDVGSSSELVSRAGAALQVLGTPGNNVIFTSYSDDAVGGDSDGQGGPAAAGQWGGIVLRHDSDQASKRAFVNSIGQATLLYGGGQVVVDAALESFAPIQVESSRPAIVFNTVRHSAGAALAATPNSFLDTGDRIGPEIRGNVLTDNSVNGLFVKIDTQLGMPLERLDVPARWKSTDVVYVISENLVIDGGVGGYVVDANDDIVARATGRLTIDPGVIVKLHGSRIELERGKGRLYAEGLPNQPVIFTSLHDNRFGAGGTFATGGDFTVRPRPGDWGGIMLNAVTAASIDQAYIAFGGGLTPIEGTFDTFNVIEVHQAELRLANSRVERNATGLAASDRTARGGNAVATVFVRGAQPIIVANDFRENRGAVISINANSLTDAVVPDRGRSTGAIARYAEFDDNFGPLVRGNRISDSVRAPVPTAPAAAVPPAAPAPPPSRPRPPTYDVVWNGVTSQAVVDRWVMRAAPGMEFTLQAEWTARDLGDGFHMVTTPGASQQAISAWAGGQPGVRYFEPDFVVETTARFPTDPSFTQLWGLHNTGQNGGLADADIDAPEAWDITTGSRSVVIAVIDTGVDYTHPDLAGNMWRNPGEIPGDGIDNDGNGFIDDVYGWDFAYDDADPMDIDGHGTHVAGTIGALANNGIGVVGVAWDVQLMALKGLGDSGSGSTADLLAAVNYATMMRRDHGVNVVATNNSWGGGRYSQALFDAIEAADRAGVLFVAAAGNSARNNDVTPFYPASYVSNNVISVAATDRSDNLASFSHFGLTSVDIGAPGVSILSTLPGNTYATYNGTSMASPHVAGVVALLAAANPGATAGEIKEAILSSARPVAGLADRVASGGVVNAYTALQAVRQNNGISGMVIRGEEITVESVWDDTDIVHVLLSEIVVQNFHSETGLRLLSRPDASLVVKLEGATAGFTAAGYPLDIESRIGGTVQIVGQPGYPVVLASLHDDSVGAGVDALGRLVTDTNANGDSTLPRPGDWRSLQFREFSNDRNVAIITESERPLIGGTDTNGRIATAQPLGILAPNFATGTNSWESAQEKSGDEYRRLGFEVHGFIAPDDPSDVDLYSFLGYAGSEVWIDLDKTSSSLDAMVEVLNAAGVVIARSVDGQTDGLLAPVTRGVALPLDKDAWRGGDHYTLNPKDPGMRLILPGTAGQQNQYFVRVRSQPRYDTDTTQAEFETAVRATNPLALGVTSGRYELRIRLRQLDEKAGSTVQNADIRHATIGIDVQGLPRNSLLLGDIGENASGGNNSFATAQYVGNLLQSDKGTLSIAGNVSSATQVDWYTFALNLEQIQSIPGMNDTGFMWATVFDIDYGAGFRGDLTISVFNDKGELIYIGRDSNVADDQPGAGQATDFDDLSRGSISPLDPFIGSVTLLAGGPTGGGGIESGLPLTPPDPSAQLRYYVAVSSNEQLPEALNATFTSTALNHLIRLEPINSLDRIVEDRISDTMGPLQIIDATDEITLQAHVTPFTLADVTLFVATGSSLVTVDAMRGGVETSITAFGGGTTIGDLVMRSDGNLYAYRGVNGSSTTAGELVRLDSGTGAVTVVGNDNVADPVTTTQINLAPSNAGTVAITTFQLAAQNLRRPQDAPITGSVRFTREIPADPGPPAIPAVTLTGTWTFTADPAPINGIATLQIQPVGAIDPLLGNEPLGGTVNLQTGVVSITWQNNVPVADVRLPTITYSSTFNDIATDQVDAVAWRRAGVGDYADLVYSVWDPGSGRSVLYLANPANGSAVFVQDQRWGLQGVLDDVGRTTGMAYVGSTLYGVDEDGRLFTIAGINDGNFTVTTTVVGTIFDGNADPIAFQGLTIGPQNLEDGLYREWLFGIDASGNLHCFDTDGQLQEVFDSDNDGSADADFIATSVSGARGLAFSPLDINLWHPTTRRENDLGHGINRAPDGTRRAEAGGLSMYFGFEQFTVTDPPYGGYAPVNGQYGATSSTWQQDLSSNPAIGNNYNLPGGAYGSMTTDAFSLDSYAYTDKPTLYFNYWLQTENASGTTENGLMRDSARVFLSIDGGFTWDLVATNNPIRNPDSSELPEFPSVSSALSLDPRQAIQQLFGTGEWRQARIDLGAWAGESNIRLRFDFSTAGMFDPNQLNADGDLLNDLVGAANETGDFNSPQRGQNNDHEGFYIDDIIVGFAERGEMVTGAVAGQTDFFGIGSPATDPFAQQILSGPYQLEIRRGTEYVTPPLAEGDPNVIVETFDTNDRLVASEGTSLLGQPLRGDSNLPREQGQFIIQGNVISDAAVYGISIDAGIRDPRTNSPIPGVPRNLPTLNNARLTPGAVVVNNLIVGSGSAGILFSGDPNTGNVPLAAVPFGRIVNNTIVGQQNGQGVGVHVTENAGPTLLNNLFANLATGISVDASSRVDGAGNERTVVGGSAYYGTAIPITGAVQSFPLVLTGNPFVNAAGRNFYLAQGSSAIDSAVNSLQDREAFRVVNSAIGVGAFPILAPDRDLYAQLRGDDPSRPNATGLGSNVFKDRGAIDRIDFAEPRMALVEPLDQRRAGGPIDQDRSTNAVRLEGADAIGVTRFVLQLIDTGTGIDPSTVTAEAITVLHGDFELVEGRDFTFQYLPGTNQLVLQAASVYRFGEYIIILGKRPATEFQSGQFTDRANNPLARNKVDGSTTFRIVLVDAPGVPTMLTGQPGNGSVALSWQAAPPPVSEPVIGYILQLRRPGTSWATVRGVVAGTATTINALTNGESYFFRVAAVTASGRGAFSVPTGPLVPGIVAAPGIPTGLNATPVTTGSMELAWVAPAENGGSAITDYTVEYRLNTVGAEWQRLARPTSHFTTATVTGLVAGQDYRFRVRAVNIEGPGDWSAEAIGLLQTAPAIPTQPVVAGGDGLVTVTWIAPDDGGSAITGYTIQYRLDSDDWAAAIAVSLPASATSHDVSGLVNGSAYRFRIAATNDIGTSGFSVQSVPVVPGGPAAAPGQLTGTVGDGQVALTWSAPSDTGGRPISDYLIQQSVDGGQTWQLAADLVTDATTAVVVGLTNNQEHVFRVAALTSIGTGRFSDQTVPLVPRAMPMSVTGSPGDRRVTLSWTAPSVPVTGYLVEYRVNVGGSEWVTFPTVGLTTTSAVVTGLTNGTSYRFRVAGVTGASDQTAFSHESAPVTPQAIASAPSNVLVSAGDQAVAVSWTAPVETGGQPITNYRVEYREAGTASWVRVDKPVSTDTFTIARSLTNGREYEFRVAAVTTELGEFSATSARVTPVGPPPTTAPPTITGAGFGGAIRIDWQAVPRALEYIVEYRVDSGTSSWVRAPIVAGTMTSTTVNSLFNRSGYRFRVGVFGPEGTIIWSEQSANIRPY